MGGLIGAVYSVGHSPDEILAYFREVDQSKLYGRRAGEQPSLLGFAGVTRVLTELIGERTFESLPFPFAVTAVDVNTGRPLVLNRGKIIDAVLATIAIPGVFPARQYEDQLLIDGGIYYPVPVEVARSMCPKYPTIAVVLSQLSESHVSLPVPHISGTAPLINYLSRLRVAQAMNIFLRSLDISGRLLTELRLEIDNPDVILRPDLSGIGLLDRVNVDEVASRGEIAAVESLSELQKVGGWQYRLKKILGVPRL